MSGSARSVALAGVLVLAVVGVTGLLGRWQLDRWSEVADANERGRANLAAEVVELSSLAPASIEESEYRRVRVEGTWLVDQEVLWRNRDRKGLNGFHVLTPLLVRTGVDPAWFDGEPRDGVAVLVNRGWVPLDTDQPGSPEFAPVGEDSDVTIIGILRRATGQPGFGARDPQTGHLDHVFNADVERIDQQVDATLLPIHLDLVIDDDPAVLPRALALPEFKPGPHFSYAMQWFGIAFAALASFGFWARRRLGAGPSVDPDDAVVDGG